MNRYAHDLQAAVRDEAALRDEAPQVYKDVAQVLARQEDLVEVVQILRPLITIKGDNRAKDD